MSSSLLDPATLLAQAGSQAHGSGDVTGGLSPSTTFARDERYELLRPTDYVRVGSPAFTDAEHLLASLEGGHQALLFASGMAAAHALLSTLGAGDHVVASAAMYWALRAHLDRFARKLGAELTLVDAWEPGAIAQALRPSTKLVWIETPANPTWEVTDIAAAAVAAHTVGAALCVDSTAATPLLTRPIELGADFVMHSATKYLNGHSDVLAGVLIAKSAGDRWDAVLDHRKAGGAVLGTFEAWLLTRGLRTLSVRVERACATALELARWLEQRGDVARVLYPGLTSHPQHEVAARQMRGGFGGMLSVCTGGGSERALAVAKRLQVFARATSLGGTESLVEHRHSVEGPGSRAPTDLLRLSIGLESVADLRADLDQALSG